MTDTLAPGLTHRIPVIGRIARDIEREPDSIWYLLVAVLSLLIIGVKIWGIAVLSLSALAMVPVIFVLLIVITLG